MKIIPETKPIRDLMPEGYTRLIMSEMGGGSASNISEVVITEKITSKYWPVIERLAMETDSKAYRERIKFIKARILTNKSKQSLSNAA